MNDLIAMQSLRQELFPDYEHLNKVLENLQDVNMKKRPRHNESQMMKDLQRKFNEKQIVADNIYSPRPKNAHIQKCTCV